MIEIGIKRTTCPFSLYDEGMMNPAINFLTPDECALVDQALLTAHDKFTTRVAIYALRSLKAIAQQEQIAIADLQPHQIEDWVYQDSSLADPSEDSSLDPVTTASNRQFRLFFSRLVISSLTPLHQIAAADDRAIDDLTVPDLITWFEAAAKQRLASS